MKWVLLYIDEGISKQTSAISNRFIPYLFVDGKRHKIDARPALEKSSINIPRAKDENPKFYGGSSIVAISSVLSRKGEESQTEYDGELLFLEVNE